MKIQVYLQDKGTDKYKFEITVVSEHEIRKSGDIIQKV